MESFYNIPSLPPLYESQGEMNTNVNSNPGYRNMIDTNQIMVNNQGVEPPQYIDNNRQAYSTINSVVQVNPVMPIQIQNFDPRDMNFANNQFQGNPPPPAVPPRPNSDPFNVNSVQNITQHGDSPELKCDKVKESGGIRNNFPEISANLSESSINSVKANTEHQQSNEIHAAELSQEEGDFKDLKSKNDHMNDKNKPDDEESDDDYDEEDDDDDSDVDEEKLETESLDESEDETEILRKEVSRSQSSGDLIVKTCVSCKAMFTSLTDKGVATCKTEDFTCQSCTESSSEDCVKDTVMSVSYGDKCRNITLGNIQNKSFNMKVQGLEKNSEGNIILEVHYGRKLEKVDISRDDLPKGEFLINFKSQKQIIRPFISPHIRQFPCSDCGDSFLDTQSLADHKLTHPSLKPWVCLECGKEFKYNNLMQRHQLSHTDIRDHVCPVCDKAFRTKANMKRHKRSAHKDVTEKESERAEEETPIRDSQYEHEKDEEVDNENLDPDYLDDMDQDDETYEERYLESIPKRPRASASKAAPKKIRYNCKMCEKGFSNKGKWKRHELYHFQMRMPVCEMCGKSFVDKDYLMEHVRTHSELFADYMCKECGMEFPFKDELQHHIMNHTGADDTTGTLPNNLPDLPANTSENENGQFSCPECPKSFRSTYILQRHMVTHNRATCQCQECGKFYSCRYNLVQHMMIHNTNSNYICDQCGESFKVKQYLSRHMIKHRETKTWACNLCDLKFYRQGNLRHHMKQHVEVKPYQCTHCQKSFVREKTLEEHIVLTHTKERPFQCPVCGRGFGLQRMIKPHMKIHSGFKEHKCEECGKLFTYKSNLNQHMMVHSGEKPFICQYCGKGFARNKYLNDHMRTHAGAYDNVIVTT